MKKQLLTIFLSITLAATALACSGDYADAGLTAVARRALSTDAAEAETAIKALRDLGPKGLEALFQVRRAGDDAVRFQRAVEVVSRQRDCHASKLFWYTDMEAAKAAATASSKPILSLRLLGKLDDELSCANSRFFRTTLYANTNVSSYLRENFVLYWESVRPVPRVTIDFGDGRKLERTITGNSIHYVLDSAGNPIDALPGLYSAKAFIAGLTTARAIADRLRALSPNQHAALLREYHTTRLSDIAARWNHDLTRVGATPVEMLKLDVVPAVAAVAPPAEVAARRAIGKTVVEMPLLRATVVDSKRWEQLRDATDDKLWSRIAELYADETRLDPNSRRLVVAKAGNAREAGRISVSKMRVEDPTLRMITNLERSIAEDTVRNEYLLHSELHRWFAEGRAPQNIGALNAKVYAELFLTPNTDPWLGLVRPDRYSGLDNDGIVAGFETTLIPITQ